MAEAEDAADTEEPQGIWASSAVDESSRVEPPETEAQQDQPPQTSNGDASRPAGVVVPPPQRPAWADARAPGPPTSFAPSPQQTPMGSSGNAPIWTPTVVLRPRAPAPNHVRAPAANLAPSGWRPLPGGGYAPVVTARELMSTPLDRIPQDRLEDLRWHLRQLLKDEAAKPPPPITAMYVPQEARGEEAESEAPANNNSSEQRGTKRPAKDMLLSSAWREGACAAADFLGKQKLAKASPGDKLELYLRQINFSQDSIKGTFQDGRLVSFMTNELATGVKTIEDIPTIMALVHNGQVYSVDNRRLWSFKNCGLSSDAKIPVIAARADKAFFNKFTTPTAGKSVKKRS